ncbi:MAG TPA: methyltransferase domain-containing protein [Nitrososphaera sp.]|nr:methyltransferase domain-containing protein [Nitrososphaera sp.]
MTSITAEDEIRQRSRLEWKAAAPGWKKYEKEMLRSMAPVSDQIIRSAGITSGHKVLDIATGAGEPALTIAKIVGPAGKVTGVDLSPEMLQTARQRAASQGITNVEFRTVEDESLSMFQDNTFDSVVCRNGLMFMPDPVKALKAFLRVLKPGGKAAVTVWGSPDKAPVMSAVMKAVSKHVPDMQPPAPGTPGTPFSIPSIDMLRGYFLQAGFSDFSATTTEATGVETNTVEEFWQGMTEVVGFLVILLSKLPEEKRQAIKNEVIQSLRSMFPSGGPVKFIGELILGVGTKPRP